MYKFRKKIFFLILINFFLFLFFFSDLLISEFRISIPKKCLKKSKIHPKNQKKIVLPFVLYRISKKFPQKSNFQFLVLHNNLFIYSVQSLVKQINSHQFYRKFGKKIFFLNLKKKNN